MIGEEELSIMDIGNQQGTSAESDSNAPLRESSRLKREISPEQGSTERSTDAETDEPRKKLAKCSTSKSELAEEGSVPGERPQEKSVEKTESRYWLPQELWIKILGNLSFRDRKNARLVCKLWRDEINAITAIKCEEILMCSGLYDCDTVMGIIQNSARKKLSLQFDDVRFSDSQRSLEFWRECGPRITYLVFSNCEPPLDETIKCVVKYCNNLRIFIWKETVDRPERGKLISTDCIESLIRMEVTGNSLITFYLHCGHSGWISNRFLQAIYLIYPNTRRNLFFSCVKAERQFNVGDITDLALLQSTERCTLTSIMHRLIECRTQLQKIYLKIDKHGEPENRALVTHMTTFVLPLHFPNLKRLHLELVTSGDRQLHDFFSRHKQLTSVDFCIHTTDAAADDMTRLMNSLLDSCPNLYSLQLQLVIADIIPTVDTSVFTKITKSRLKTLAIFNFDFAIAPEDTEIVNNHLKTLLIGSGIENDTFRAFCKVFRSLNTLEGYDMNDDCLQAIFQYQRCLKSLNPARYRQCTDYGFTGYRPDEENNDQPEGFSIQRLYELQYLNLKLRGVLSSITERTTAEFEFPNLVYLRAVFDHPWQLYHNFILGIISNSPKLEGIWLFCDETITPDVWIRACQCLKSLRYLYVVGREFHSFDDDLFRRLFEFCPTLRAITFRNRKSSSTPYSRTYFYDVITREVTMKTDENLHKIPFQPINSHAHVAYLWY